MLAGSTALAAFLNDPEPFINGTSDLAHAISVNVIQPVAAATGEAVRPAVQAAGQAMQPAVLATITTVQRLTLYAGVTVIVVLLGIASFARMLSKSGFLGKLILRTGLRLAGDQVVSAVKK